MGRCPAGQKRLAFAVLVGSMASTLAGVGPAMAEDPSRLDSVLKTLNLKADPGRAPDFIEASRPDAPGDYVPVGRQHPERSVKVKSPADLQAAESELDALRARHDRLAGRKPAAAGKAPMKPQMAGAKPGAVKAKPPSASAAKQN